ncbi:ornithine carbamoyltransferase [Euryarchaeota archaeon ex4484_162]|nr:MAG: ornithine carbamoyltransferase [Euryarchaeota archaeon ex4484_162]RLF28433.1 MAG: ornithine carbamoyltransferase [Thermoplasmata archaeon]RLF34835.1 MAG: ornithine carbamoyltransferase [Thermoplasmata archaeon]
MRKDVLSILDVEDEIEDIINLGIKLKRDFKEGKKLNYLREKTLAMIFERESTRTRVSFEVAMTLLGGHAIYLNRRDIKIGERESAEDTAQVLSRYVDAIMYRSLNKRNLYDLAEHAAVPVINGLDEDEHPCQILADLMSIKEKKGRLDGLKFVFIGDGDDNLTHSYLLGCVAVGMNICIVSPKKYWPKKYFIEKTLDIANKKNLDVILTEDVNAVKEADVIATDTWVSLWYENERERRIRDFHGYTVTTEVMNLAKKDAIFLHCMPVHYGEEATREVVHGPQSIIIDEAENRLWAEMALLIKLLR